MLSSITLLRLLGERHSYSWFRGLGSSSTIIIVYFRTNRQKVICVAVHGQCHLNVLGMRKQIKAKTNVKESWGKRRIRAQSFGTRQIVYLLGDTSTIMSRQGNLNSIVHIEPFWMMISLNWVWEQIPRFRWEEIRCVSYLPSLAGPFTFSAKRALRLMNDHAWLKSVNSNVFWMALPPST